MKVSLEELYKGKATKIKEKEYFSPEQYVSPFIERISKFTKDIVINVKPSDQITLTRDGDVNFDDILYNRVWIQGIINHEYKHENLKQVISMIYALDTRKPIVKFYTGAISDMNLITFDSDALSISELKPETAVNFKPVESLLNRVDINEAKISELEKKVFSKKELEQMIGNFVDNCINKKYNNGFGLVKLSESIPIDAYKDLFYDEDSKVFKKNMQASLFDLYYAFANLLTSDTRDFVNRFEKTLLISKILNI